MPKPKGSGANTKNTQKRKPSSPLADVKNSIEKVAKFIEKNGPKSIVDTYLDTVQARNTEDSQSINWADESSRNMDTGTAKQGAKELLVSLKQTYMTTGHMDQAAVNMALIEYMITDCDIKEQRISALEKKMEAIEKINDNLAREVAHLKRGAFRDEIREAKHGILVRGVAEGNDEKKTLDSFRDEAIYGLLKVAQGSVKSMRRVPAGKIREEKAKAKGETVTRPILIKFDTIGGKYSAFKGLNNLKNVDKAKSWRFAQEVPLCLKAKWAGLENEAYEIRKANKGARTKIMWEGDDCMLVAKLPGDSDFNAVAVGPRQ